MEINRQQELAYYQNLNDAGCTEEEIQKCISLIKENKLAAMVEMLSTHRNKLLKKIHDKQKQIDCLDYFVYKIKKDN